MMWGGWGWGGWLFMGFMMVLFWGLVVAGVIALVHYVSSGTGRGDRRDLDGDQASRILAERFARGEIGADEYDKGREVLRSR